MANVRSTQLGVEVLMDASKVRTTQLGVEALLDASKPRTTQLGVEILYSETPDIVALVSRILLTGIG